MMQRRERLNLTVCQSLLARSALVFLCLLLALGVEAENIGRETAGVNTRSLNNLGIQGLRVVMPEDGQAGVTITAYIEDTAPGDQFRAAIIDDADKSVVLAYSDIRTDVSTVNWYTFSGGTLASFSPANGTAYLVVVLSDSAAGAFIYEDDVGADGYSGQANVFDPLSIIFDLEPDIRDFSIYMTYTPVSSGGLLLRRRRAANDDHFDVPERLAAGF